MHFQTEKKYIMDILSAFETVWKVGSAMQKIEECFCFPVFLVFLLFYPFENCNVNRLYKMTQSRRKYIQLHLRCNSDVSLNIMCKWSTYFHFEARYLVLLLGPLERYSVKEIRLYFNNAINCSKIFIKNYAHFIYLK